MTEEELLRRTASDNAEVAMTSGDALVERLGLIAYRLDALDDQLGRVGRALENHPGYPAPRPMTEEDLLRRMAREVNEIIMAAPLDRMCDEDGTEWVARDALADEVRKRFLALIRQAKR